ncbi:MAG: hypothetical protein JWP12_3839 [Bacteroidetes bacterium]|nr:hypothetical protein [Bacteroidota bacterium]
MMRRIPFVIVVAIVLMVVCCKTGGTSIVLFEDKAEVKFTVNSACRNSAILPLANETGLKSNVQSYAASAIKNLKFKTNSSLEKSTCRISRIEMIITETCEAAKPDGNPPSLKLKQKLSLENTVTKQVYSFETDTIINNQKLNPGQLAVKKVNYEAYFQPLTDRNFKKAKTFFSKKK